MNTQLAREHQGLSLSTTSYPCSGLKKSSAPLVLVHGWGNDSRVWQLLIPMLQQTMDVITLDLPGFGDSPVCATIDQTLELMAKAIPAGANLLGWSLGGMLATRFAAQFPEQINRLVTIAANLSFVAREDWSDAMPAQILDGFIEQFSVKPERTLKQFCGLEAKGDLQERELLRWLRDNSAEAEADWVIGLQWLRELDNRQAFTEYKESASLHLFAEMDALVPAKAATMMTTLNDRARIKVLPGVSHALHLSSPDQVAKLITQFLLSAEPSIEGAGVNPYQLEKKKIADSFGKAANSYDSVAELQRQVGQNLMESVDGLSKFSSMADMGCGTGFFTEKLAQLNSQAQCYGIDLSPGMIAYAASHHQGDIHWLCGDAESLPLPDNSLDFIFSNFVFQWCQNLTALMAEQFRLLSPGGVLAFSIVGPRSLWELRDAWQKVDRFVHVNQFASQESVLGSLESAGFEVSLRKTENLTRFYPQLNALTRELKNLGAHNVNAGRQTGLTGRRRIEGLKNAYEEFRQQQGLPATWEVFYLVAIKPQGEQR